MKRALRVTALLAMGVLVASSFAAAQDMVLPKDYFLGDASISLLGRSDIDSSKFQEYRDLSNGVYGPRFSVAGLKNGIDFSLSGQNIQQQDQRYFGRAAFSWGEFKFDYNQTPHNMGNAGRTILTETSPGVYSVSPTLRKGISNSVDATAVSARTFPFYTTLLNPSFATANSVDVSSQRDRGSFEFNLGQKLPFDLALTYVREHKTGYRGLGGGDIVSGAVSPVVEVPEPLDEIVQDVGLRASYTFKAGNVHASVNRNLYNNRAETLVLDNPFLAADAAYKAGSGSVSAIGGPASVRFVNAPDNEATTGRFGVQLKFKKQTRITGDVSLASWTQNAAFFPATINSAILTPAGNPANVLSAINQSSLNGKIGTTTLNLGFVTRPVNELGIRVRYRSYSLTNNTARSLLSGSTSGSPDRSWETPAAAAGEPFGYATATNYDTTTKRFEASASYDVKRILTIEGVGRLTSLTRTNREATSGNENGYSFSALLHATDWLVVRARTEWLHRTADGQAGQYGFQADEAERTMRRTGLDIELTPVSMFSVSFGYFRRNVDFPRPNTITVGGVLAPGTGVGLMGTGYDSYTTELQFTPNARAELSGYYTWEKDTATNRWGRTLPTNLMTYAGNDKTNSFGANAVFHVVPDKWTFSLSARRQHVDGFMGVSTDPANSFFIARASVGGPQPFNDWDDTKLTTGVAQIDYAFSKTWTFTVGYAYEDYQFANAFTSGVALMPQSVLIFMKPDNGGYHANLGFATLNYRF